MIGKLLKKIEGRIAHKLALWVIIFSIGITLMTSAIQLYLDYSQDINGIKKYFDSITEMQLKSLSQAVWIMDDKQILAHLNGITKGRDIIYASVNVDGRLRWESGHDDSKNSMRVEHELTFFHRDAVFKLGTLQIVAGLENLYKRLSWTAFIILLTNGLKTFLFAGCILLYFQFAVTRHLEKLASHMVHMDFRRKIRPLKLNRKGESAGDEFDQVVNMLNVLQRRGFHAFSALEKSEQRLRLFLDATEEGIFGINAEGRITFSNSSCLTMLNYQGAQTIIGKKVEDLIRYESRMSEQFGSNSDIFLEPLQSGRSLTCDDGYLKVEEGVAFYASVRTYPIVSNKQSTGAVIFFNNVSEQREVLKEKNLLSQAVRQSPMLVVVTDAEGKIEYVNPEFERLTGLTFKEITGRKPFFFDDYAEDATLLQEIMKTLMAGEKWQGTYRLKAKDKKYHTFDTLVSPVLNNHGEIINIIALCLDITQKIALQKQLHHAQKMEAVGRLSASFAHEFGNPLFGVRSVIKDISERIAMADEDKQLLELAYSECERMKSLIHDFQRFQSNGSDKKDYHDIHVILNNVLLFNKKHFEKNNIVLNKNYFENLPYLHVNKNQIAQVFLNLAINALDAMGDQGGILDVSTRVVEREVHIDFKDSGSGINEIDRDLIFEPFYTTKPDVQGTGLGLSVSYGIISGHGGDITVTSQVNAGSTFTVRLPLHPLNS